MGRSTIGWSVVVAYSLMLGNASMTRATEYTFSKLADTGGLFDSLGPPSLNDKGTIAFLGTSDVNVQGLFRITEGVVKKVTEYREVPNSPLGRVAGFSLNNNGDIAYSAGSGCCGQVMTLYSGGNRTVLLSYGGFSLVSFGNPSLNDNGVVTFWGERRTGRTDYGIFTMSNNVLSTIIAGESFPQSGPNGAQINDTGMVAFVAGGQIGLFSNSKLDFFPFPGAFSQVSSLAINGTGTIGVGVYNSGVFKIEAGIVTPVSASAGSAPSVSVNDAGLIAFLIQDAILTGVEPEAQRIVGVGDVLFGSKVSGVGLGQEGLNNSGQIAFWARFEDGNEAIFIATPFTRDLHVAFRRADSNADSQLDVSDALAMLLRLFAGAESQCLSALDANDDGRLDLSDPIGFVAYLYNAGFAPPPPFGACDRDPTPDELSCETFEPCR